MLRPLHNQRRLSVADLPRICCAHRCMSGASRRRPNAPRLLRPLHGTAAASLRRRRRTPDSAAWSARPPGRTPRRCGRCCWTRGARRWVSRCRWWRATSRSWLPCRRQVHYLLAIKIVNTHSRAVNVQLPFCRLTAWRQARDRFMSTVSSPALCRNAMIAGGRIALYWQCGKVLPDSTFCTARPDFD